MFNIVDIVGQKARSFIQQQINVIDVATGICYFVSHHFDLTAKLVFPKIRIVDLLMKCDLIINFELCLALAIIGC